MKPIYKFILTIVMLFVFPLQDFQVYSQNSASEENVIILNALLNKEEGIISIVKSNDPTDTLLVQNAQEGIRPYIHPIIAPDGEGVLTQYRPGHHTHQTGIYWGLKEVNGRDYFMDCCVPGETSYYRKLSVEILVEEGEKISWQTVYDLIDEHGNTLLTETKIWTMKQTKNKYFLDLDWIGLAKSDITIGEFYVGGLFVRMPWYNGIDGEVVNSLGQINNDAEAKRALWTNVGMEIEGRNDWGNIVIFDHKSNTDFPISWRVDRELGIGPSRQIMGDWYLQKGKTEKVRYRVMIYTGQPDTDILNAEWHRYNVENKL